MGTVPIRALMSLNKNTKALLEEAPWNEPSEWYSFRCHSCDYREWVEDIVFFAFPHTEPGKGPILYCPECENDFIYDPSIPIKLAYERPT